MMILSFFLRFPLWLSLVFLIKSIIGNWGLTIWIVIAYAIGYVMSQVEYDED